MKELPPPSYVSADRRDTIQLSITPVNNSREPFIEEENRPREKCGIAAIYSTTMPIETKMKTLLLAGEGVQHRGQQGAGFGLPLTDGTILTRTGNGLLEEALPHDATTDLPDKVSDSWATIHTRYSTEGSDRPYNLHPIRATTPDGINIAVSHNGTFSETRSMREHAGGDHPADVSDTYLFTHMLANTPGKNMDERVINAMKAAPGAASLLIGVGDTLYVARDENGVRPLIIGEVDGAFMAASETLAFDKVQGEPKRKVKAGEILKVTPDGITVIQEGTEDKAFCAIEFPYFSNKESKHADSKNPEDWKELAQIRRDIGRRAARERKEDSVSRGEEPVPPDVVLAVENSGTEFAEGYAKEWGTEVSWYLKKNPEHKKRLFQDNDIDSIMKQYNEKLLLEKAPELVGANVHIVDDSGIRGNVQRNLTPRLFDAGAKEVHYILGTPPVVETCHLGVNISSKDELVAWKNGGDLKAIAKDVGNATSVQYISDEGFVRSIKNGSFAEPTEGIDVFRANGICGGCLGGEYPVPRENALLKSTDVFVPREVS